MSKKIKVTSLVPYKVGLIIPEHRFSRTFTQEGQSILVDEEILREGLYNRGVLNVFKKGILEIDPSEKAFKIEVGLEDEGQEETLVSLNTSQMKALLAAKPYKEFEEVVDTLSNDQLELMVDIAVENKLTDYQKCRLLKEKTGKDIMKMIPLHEEE